MEHTPEDIVQALLAIKQERGNHDLLRRIITPADKVTLLPNKEDFLGHMQDLDRAWQEKGYGKVLWSDGRPVPPVGRMTPQGKLIAAVFTQNQTAMHYAQAHGMKTGDAPLISLQKSWVKALYEFLADTYAGIDIDPETNHAVTLSQAQVRSLYATLTLERILTQPQLLLVVDAVGHPYLVRNAKGQVMAVGFETAEAAQHGLAKMPPQAHTNLATAAHDPALLHTALRGTGARGVVVNLHLPDQRAYALTAFAPQASRPRRSAAPRTAQHRRSRLGAWLGTRAPDQDSPPFAIWEGLEEIASCLEVFVPVHPKPVDGMHWPQYYQSYEDPTKAMVKLYTDAAEAQMALDKLAPAYRQLIHLTGLEALRWVVSMPARIDYLVFDYFPDSAQWLTVPFGLARLPLFPLCYPIGSLEDVPAHPLTELARLPGARGQHPQVMRAFVFGLHHLLAPVLASGQPLLVEHQGGQYRALFTLRERANPFIQQGGGLRYQRLADHEPCVDLLRQAAQLDGIVLDPGGSHAIVLDHVALLAMAAWAEAPRQPMTPRRYYHTLATLHASMPFDDATLGHLVAAFPDVWKPLQQRADGAAEPIVDAQGAMLLFSDKSMAVSWLDNLIAQRQAPAKTTYRLSMSRWGSSPYHAAVHTGQTVILNQAGRSAQGLRLNARAVQAAAARLDAIFRPCLPRVATL